MAGRLPNASSRSQTTSCRSSRVRSIRLCTASSTKAGSRPSGANRRTTAKRNTTRSPPPAESSCEPSSRIGSASRAPSGWSLTWLDPGHGRRLLERLLAVLVALRDFLLGCSAALVLVFDKRRNRISVLLQKLQNRLDWRVAFAPWHIRPIVFLPVFQMHQHDVLMILLDVIDSIESRRREMPDI